MNRHAILSVYAGVAFIGIIFGILLPSGRSAAHPASTYYDEEWPADSDYAIGQVSSTFNNSTALNSMKAGVNPWQLAAGATFDFRTYVGHFQDRFWTGSACSTANIDQTWVLTYPLPSHLGLTNLCLSGGTIDRVVIRVSTSYTFDQNGGSIPSGQYDLRGLMVHEFGHATGFRGHFTGSICSGTSAQTMCASLGSGSNHWQTTETHDEHTFASAY